MDLSKEHEQRKEFCDILLELSKSQDVLQDSYCRSKMYKRLEALYFSESKDKSFRHFYTDIFSVLTQIQQDVNLGDINILGQNLEMIRSGYKPSNKTSDGRTIDISDAIKKLYDHVNLDLARITYADATGRKFSGESSAEKLQNLETQITSLQNKVKEANEIEKKIIDVEAKLDNSQKEYITILGIFAAVVLSFTGGITFSTSVLNNLAQASIYRTILISLIIGLVLINILFGLFYYINLLVNKNQKFYPILLSNIVIVSLITITFIAWQNAWVENRNKRISENEYIIKNMSTPSENSDTNPQKNTSSE